MLSYGFRFISSHSIKQFRCAIQGVPAKVDFAGINGLRPRSSTRRLRPSATPWPLLCPCQAFGSRELLAA
jgi:hypothetical protein